uniref:Transposase n=1 Tax=Angiostrongylus cantonensis TaxID=6313 RepID=A0A0K0DE12_ANGCA
MSKTVLLFKKGDFHDIGNYRLSFESSYAGLTGYWSKDSHVGKQERAFDLVETEAVMEAVDAQPQNISQDARIVADFDKTCGRIGRRLNLTKTMFLRNGLVSYAPLTLNGMNITERSSNVYLGREINKLNGLAPELSRRERVAWKAFNSIEDVVKRTKNTQLRVTFPTQRYLLRNQYDERLSSRAEQKETSGLGSIEDVVKRTENTRLRAHLFYSTVLPALTHASETWSLRKQDERSLSVIERPVERMMLGVSRFAQVRDGIRSSGLRQRSKIKDAALHAKLSKIR